MDTVLVLVTGSSLALAAAMAVLLVRVLRDERRRSEARIALLTELAAEPQAPLAQAAVTAIRERPSRDRLPAFEDLDLRPAPPLTDAGRPDLFRHHEEPSPWPRRLAVAAGLSAVAIALAIGWQTNAPEIDAAAAVPATEASVGSPLELLTLSHAQEPGAITIRGRVQNPRSSPPLSGVQATVLVLGRDGATMSSGRASLEAAVLRPGEESAFTVRVPVADAAARYRVGFRGQNDQALGHIDRRSAESIARKEAP